MDSKGEGAAALLKPTWPAAGAPVASRERLCPASSPPATLPTKPLPRTFAPCAIMVTRAPCCSRRGAPSGCGSSPSLLSWYNSATYWIDIDLLLSLFGLTRDNLSQTELVNQTVRTLAARLPTYITLKDVKKRWGKGQEDFLPVAQFEKLRGDMTGIAELRCPFAAVPPPARPTIEGTRPARWLAARWVSGIRRVPVQLGPAGSLTRLVKNRRRSHPWTRKNHAELVARNRPKDLPKTADK